MTPLSSLRVPALILFALSAACGGGGTEPPTPANVVAVTANPLASAVVGSVVASAPTFEVRSTGGRALAGIPVNVVVTAGGGSLTGAPSVTLAGPTSIGQWTLGTTAGDQTVTVTAAGLTPLVFTLPAAAGAATQLAVLDGDDQFGSQNSVTFAPLRVRVRDQFNNNVAGATVNWAVDAGGGSLAGGATSSVTDANGIATAPAWTLGTIAAGEQAVVASLGGLTARFTASVQRAPATISVESSPAATATVNADIAPAPSFAVRDSSGNALQGIPLSVTLTAGNGSLTGAPTVSAAGTTTVGTWRIGTTVGTNTVSVSIPGAAHVTARSWSVTGLAGPAAAMLVIAGSNQTALAGAAVTTAPRARVTDAFANPLAGLPVTWTVTAGGGTLGGAATVNTDANGFVDAPTWTLGRRGGTQALTASHNAVSAQFPAFIQTAYTVDVRFSGTPPTGAVAQAFADAQARIMAMVTGDIPDIVVRSLTSATQPFNVADCGVSGVTGSINETVDDVVIFAAVDSIDGVGRVLGSAGPCLVRNTSSMAALGIMKFDRDDLINLANAGRLNDVITHEMLHIVGIGTNWRARGLLADSGLATVRVTGALAAQACVDVGGGAVCPGSVPAENCLDLAPGTSCGQGTINSHWKESTFRTELMTGYAGATNPLSRITVQGIADLGYTVNVLAADPYTVPPPTLMAMLRMEGDVPTAEAEIRLAEPIQPKYAIDPSGRLRRVLR